MKLVKFIFLIALFCLPLNVAAQVPITQGSISVLSNPYTQRINTHFGFQQGLVAILNSDDRNGAPLPFFSTRPVTGFTSIVEPTPEARGVIVTCPNGLFTHPDQPLSTRFELTLSTFRVPRFPKREGPQTYYAEVSVPFTMTGRLSCLTDNGQVSNTRLISGAGSARLRFQRLDSDVRRIYLTSAVYSFASATP